MCIRDSPTARPLSVRQHSARGSRVDPRARVEAARPGLVGVVHLAAGSATRKPGEFGGGDREVFYNHGIVLSGAGGVGGVGGDDGIRHDQPVLSSR